MHDRAHEQEDRKVLPRSGRVCVAGLPTGNPLHLVIESILKEQILTNRVFAQNLLRDRKSAQGAWAPAKRAQATRASIGEAQLGFHSPSGVEAFRELGFGVKDG